MVTAYGQRVDTFPSDPDLRHLADLLNFLPGPDDPLFWRHLPGDDPTNYVLEKLVAAIPTLRKADPTLVEVRNLAKYLMMFFAADTPAMFDHIGRQTDASPYKHVGRLWVEDLHATCWRLYVRSQPNQARLEAWPASFHAWLKEGREDE
jgi:hypothetical protein